MINNPFEQFRVNHYELKNYLLNNISISSTNFIYITDTLIICCWIIVFYLLIYYVMLLRKQKFTQNSVKKLFGILYVFVYNNVKSYLPKEAEIYFPFFFYLFLFITTSNLIGIIPFSYTITSHLSITFGLAFSVRYSTLIIGFQKNGLRFFYMFLPRGIPFRLMPFLIAIEIISYMFRSVSLALRLFANIVAGHILLDTLAVAIHKIIYPVNFNIMNLIISIVPLIVIIILIIFECIVAILQAYIFIILSCIYLKDAYSAQNH